MCESRIDAQLQQDRKENSTQQTIQQFNELMNDNKDEQSLCQQKIIAWLGVVAD
jgi:hypothetical protein